MYDKVRIWKARTAATPDPQTVGGYLSHVTTEIDEETGEMTKKGKLETLSVRAYEGGISVIGSLPKYLHGSNVFPLDRNSTAAAIEKLSDGLHVDMSDAKVNEIEFGTQFPMKHSVEEYLKKLGDMPQMRRCHFETGSLYYKPRGKQQSKELVFYDKRADAQAKGLMIPGSFTEANLLKYEMRLNGRLPQQIGVPIVEVATLYDREFYRLLVRRWQEYYFSISKLDYFKPDFFERDKNPKGRIQRLGGITIQPNRPDTYRQLP